jgi:small subunit ribosomal protein S2
MADGLLIKQESYLETGIHIGTKLRTIDMVKFIYRTRNDGLFVLDLRAIDERIRLVAKVLAKYEPEDIVIIASRTYSSISAKIFSQLTGAKVIGGRFVPGIFTNVARDDFIEPKLVLICDPKGERQAVVECGKMGISTVGLCDTDNFTMFIDWVIPCNNKGRRSLALIFWLLARELAMSKGKIQTYEEFEPTFEGFEALANQLADDDSIKKDEEEAQTDASSTEQVSDSDEEQSASDDSTDNDDSDDSKSTKTDEKSQSNSKKPNTKSKTKTSKKPTTKSKTKSDSAENESKDSKSSKKQSSQEDDSTATTTSESSKIESNKKSSE